MIKKNGRDLYIYKGIINYSASRKLKFDEEIEKIIIKSNFDFDDDLAPHFSEYLYLKEFEIGNKATYFEVYDGILYMRLNEESRKGSNNIYMNCYSPLFYGSPKGLVLLSCPECIKEKDIVIHQDCTIIYGSAFAGCNLNSLLIPDSFIEAIPAAFMDVTIKKLIVPNNLKVWVEDSHSNVNKDITVECTGGDDISKSMICRWWKEKVTGDYE